MATTTGTNNLYDKVKEKLLDGTIDLDDDTFQVMLLTNAYTPNQATHEFVSDIVAQEVGGGTGYVRQTLTTVQWVVSGGANGQMKFDADNPQWAAAGGNIVARYWALFKDDVGGDTTSPLLAYGLLDDTPADVTTTDGNTLTLNVNVNGFFTVG